MTTIKLRMVIILLAMAMTGACARSGAMQPREKPASVGTGVYTWSSFFNQGCGYTMELLMQDDNSGTLLYRCPDGEPKSQVLQHQPGQGPVHIWVADRLAPEGLYRLSGSKCQASIVMLGAENATIQYPCALVHMTVGYRIEDRMPIEGQVRIRLKPERVLVVYSDGTQEFSVSEQKLVPKGPFEPFKTKPLPHMSL